MNARKHPSNHHLVKHVIRVETNTSMAALPDDERTTRTTIALALAFDEWMGGLTVRSHLISDLRHHIGLGDLASAPKTRARAIRAVQIDDGR